MRELNAREKDLLHRIDKKPELQPFFFRKAKGLHWFDPLCERGYFGHFEWPTGEWYESQCLEPPRVRRHPYEITEQ